MSALLTPSRRVHATPDVSAAVVTRLLKQQRCMRKHRLRDAAHARLPFALRGGVAGGVTGSRFFCAVSSE